MGQRPHDYEVKEDSGSWWVTYPPRNLDTAMGPYGSRKEAIDDAELEIVQFAYDDDYE